MSDTECEWDFADKKALDECLDRLKAVGYRVVDESPCAGQTAHMYITHFELPADKHCDSEVRTSVAREADSLIKMMLDGAARARYDYKVFATVHCRRDSSDGTVLYKIVFSVF
jgi:hypothetical protein